MYVSMSGIEWEWIQKGSDIDAKPHAHHSAQNDQNDEWYQTDPDIRARPASTGDGRIAFIHRRHFIRKMFSDVRIYNTFFPRLFRLFGVVTGVPDVGRITTFDACVIDGGEIFIPGLN